MAGLYRESAGKSWIEAAELRLGRAEQLAAMSYEQRLETKVAFGSAEGLVDWFAQLKEKLGLDAVVAELNAGDLIPEERVTRSLRVLTE